MTQPTQAQIRADMRFREFGNGATWVDFPMTQDSAQIGKELRQDADARYRQGYREGVREAEARTIERCAQVVDGLAKKANRSEITKLEEAAAAIRAMKD